VIVIEASAMVHALVGEGVDPELLALLADEELQAPALLDFEVVLAQALGAPLVTSDEKLTEARRLGVAVRVFLQR
jgi:predicted nucleic acid-binding protein